MHSEPSTGKPQPALRCYRVRLRGLPRIIDSNFLMEKLIGCFSHHQRNLYDSPDFVLCGVARYGRNLDLLLKTASKDRLLERLQKLKLPFKSLRCRPFDPTGWRAGHGFDSWLVAHYGLDSSDSGRRRVRVAQRRPVGNNYTYHVWNRTAQRRLLFGPVEKDMMLETIVSICRQCRVQLHAFVIMGNHFHLVVTTQNDFSISQLMQKIDWRITTQFNRLHQSTGTLWQGPFRHTVWEPTAANLLYLINYVHANPLRAALETQAGQYGWSSYAHYAGTARRKGLVVPLSIRRRCPQRLRREVWYREQFDKQYRSGKLHKDPRMDQSGLRGSKKFLERVKRELAGPMRLPAFVKNMLKLKRQGAVWGLKTLLHLLCKPMVDAWLLAKKCWKELVDRIDTLVPVPEPSG